MAIRYFGKKLTKSSQKFDDVDENECPSYSSRGAGVPLRVPGLDFTGHEVLCFHCQLSRTLSDRYSVSPRYLLI